jgi:hypothetical protein
MVLKEVVKDVIKEVLVDTRAEKEPIRSDSVAIMNRGLSL